MHTMHAERHELLHRRAQLPEELRRALLPQKYGRPGVRPKLTRRSAREKRALVRTGGRRASKRAPSTLTSTRPCSYAFFLASDYHLLFSPPRRSFLFV